MRKLLTNKTLSKINNISLKSLLVAKVGHPLYSTVWECGQTALSSYSDRADSEASNAQQQVEQGLRAAPARQQKPCMCLPRAYAWLGT